MKSNQTKSLYFKILFLSVCSLTLSCSWDRFVLSRVNESTTVKVKAAKELLDKDKITIVLTGTGSPLPSESIQNSTAIFVNGQFLLFDAGDGVAMAMEKLHLPVSEIGAVFITHFHSDHFADLGEVIDRSWLLGRQKPLTVHGPKGISDLVNGFLKSYQLEYHYRTKHHGEAVMPSQWKGAKTNEFSPKSDGSSKIIYEKDGVVVHGFFVNHEPVEPAVGYRVEYKGKSIVISGDTANSEFLKKQSFGADYLISEVMNKSMIAKVEKAYESIENPRLAKIMKDIQLYHIDATELGNLAEAAKVKTLVLTHMIPFVKGYVQTKAIYKDPIQKVFHGELIIAHDGKRIEIPLP
ncbi:MBL fold metallo-hydrolase [Leptospira noumeaensis]|uniref:MBL fold metallo-hydrolase n=1 Tax=Leptospira noumeaensis TaxID=2484964 RepID=A0A4R9IHG7_9LEPT|nr:MBL fold metallo-hydrolase [Leptospira noumeaensis]TGK87912.1 MBL fold metallo-hydrolase [Leptospira noumeaensis]